MMARAARLDTASVEAQSSILRLALAVRGWSRPLDLAKNGETSEILDAVAQEVVLDLRAHPGEWWLRAETRRRVFATRQRAEILNALEAAPADPIAKALRILSRGRGIEAELPSLSDEDLRALSQAIGWLADPAAASSVTELTTSELERLAHLVSGVERNRVRRSDVRRMVRDSVGFSELADKVFASLFSKSSSGDPRVAYLWGPGGSGKSTLIAEVEFRAGKLDPPPLIVHLDFDRPTLDPAKPQTLTLELLRQATADPERGGQKARDALIRYASSVAEQSRSAVAVAAPSKVRDAASARIERVVKAAEGVALESLRAERSLDFYDALSEFGSHYRHLLLVLDTIEALEPVQAGGAAVMGALQEWVRRIGRSSGIGDVKVLAAGRRSRKPANGLVWFQDFQEVEEFELTALSVPEKEQLLRSARMPEELLQLAATKLPGVPLIVRMTAETARAAGPDLSSIVRSLQEGPVDPSTAARYLEERLVRHVPEAWARPFVIASLALPETTPRLLEKILIPALIESATPKPRLPRPARKNADPLRFAASLLFDALARLTWLTDAKVSRRCLSIIPKVRLLLEPLIAADPAAREVQKVVHAKAVLFYMDRKDGHGRRMHSHHLERYHLAALGRDRSEPRSASSMRSISNLGSGKSATSLNLRRMEWAQSFELTALKHLETGTARAIVDQWRRRPGELKLSTPDILLRALADTGAYFSSFVDFDTLLHRLASPPETPRGHATFKATAADLLPMALSRSKTLSRRRQLAHVIDRLAEIRSERAARDFDALVAGALILRRHVKPSTLSSLYDEASTWKAKAIRAALIRCIVGNDAMVEVDLSQLLVAQRDFERRSRAPQFVVSILPSIEGASDLKSIDRSITTLTGRAGRLDLGEDPRAALLWLRGTTPELHSPLRYALEDCWTAATNDASDDFKNVLRSLVAHVTEKMSILPEEMGPDQFWRHVEFDSAAWFGAFVRFVDTARLMRFLADEILKLSPGGRGRPFDRLHLVAEQIVLWDRALTSGGNSSWTRWS